MKNLSIKISEYNHSFQKLPDNLINLYICCNNYGTDEKSFIELVKQINLPENLEKLTLDIGCQKNNNAIYNGIYNTSKWTNKNRC